MEIYGSPNRLKSLGAVLVEADTAAVINLFYLLTGEGVIVDTDVVDLTIKKVV